MGVFQLLLCKRRSSERESGGLSGEGGCFGLGICIGLSRPHARKTWHTNHITKILEEDEIFSKDKGERGEVTRKTNASYRLGYCSAGWQRGRAHDTTERTLSCLRPPANFAFSYWLSLLVKNTSHIKMYKLKKITTSVNGGRRVQSQKSKRCRRIVTTA